MSGINKYITITLLYCVYLVLVSHVNNATASEVETRNISSYSRRFLNKIKVEVKVKENYNLEKAKHNSQELLDLIYNRYELGNEKLSLYIYI